MSAAEPGVGVRPPSVPRATDSRARPDPAAGRVAGAPLAPAAVVLLIALTITWGLNWPMMKLALAEVPPWTFRTLCLMVGGSICLALARASGGPIGIAKERLPALALVSLFNITGWHLFSAYAVLLTGAGRAAIIGYTMPLWASLLGIWVLRTRPSAALSTVPGYGSTDLPTRSRRRA